MLTFSNGYAGRRQAKIEKPFNNTFYSILCIINNIIVNDNFHHGLMGGAIIITTQVKHFKLRKDNINLIILNR